MLWMLKHRKNIDHLLLLFLLVPSKNLRLSNSMHQCSTSLSTAFGDITHASKCGFFGLILGEQSRNNYSQVWLCIVSFATIRCWHRLCQY